MDRRTFLLQTLALPFLLLASEAGGAPAYLDLPLRDIEGRVGTLGAAAAGSDFAVQGRDLLKLGFR